jgi:hypothetical protein
LRSVALFVTAVLLLSHSRVARAAGGDGDADGDGIPDLLEAEGDPGEPLLDFPSYGADPAVPDVFVQMDWDSCDPIVEYCGPNNSFDQHQLSSDAAARLAGYFAPDVALHIDNGVEPRDPARATLHGAWGGAHRLPRGQQQCNPDVIGARFGSFHRGISAAFGGGGGGDLFGFCFGGDSVNMGVLAQELGHNFGINHGGNADSWPANCKPNYRSPMNYAFTYDPRVTQFSRGENAARVLDPVAMDEPAGLGADPAVRTYLAQSPWEYLVRDDGAVDWNRNGVIDELPVRAAATWAWASCEQSVEHSDFFEKTLEPGLAWLPDAAAPQLYLVGRDRDAGTLVTRFATRFDRCNPQSTESCVDWSPALGQGATPVPGSEPGTGGTAVLGFTPATGPARLAVAYARADGVPVLQEMVAGEWTMPVAIGGEATGGDPALAMSADLQRLVFLAPVGGRLVRRERARTIDGVWSAATEETWADGTPIETCAGVGLTRGFLRSLPGGGARLFLALAKAPDCGLVTAYYDETNAAWVPAGSFLNAVYPPFTNARPALAFVPYANDAPEDGRFYLSWRPYPTGAAMISLSEGNDVDAAATSRRLIFRRGTYLRNVWALLEGSVALEYDPRFDTNLRAAWVYAQNRVAQVNPFADGILDVKMRDQDDYHFILANLACSLDGSCPR